MATKRESIHGQWSGRLAFILAATGSAVGLGNIWKFPYITGENGGGAFVLVYLVCIGVIGIPIMMAEVMLGRRGRQSPINTMRTLAYEEKVSPAWRWLGWAGVLAGFLILSYYSVIAGWALAYVFRAGSGLFTGLTPDGVQSIFGNLVGDANGDGKTLLNDSAFVKVPNEADSLVDRAIEVGLSDGLKLEVVSGLAVGDSVVEEPPKEIE